MKEESNESFIYTETKVLENLREAKHYNTALVGLAEKAYPLQPETKILDFGAGLGTFAELFKEQGHTVDCLEIDQVESEMLRKKGFETFQRFDEIGDGTYDFIYTYNVLEHIEDDAGAIESLKRLLKPEGKLFIFVPAHQSLYSDMDRAVGHLRRYQKADLREAISKGGFHVETMHYFDAIGYFAALVFKLLGSKNEDLTRGKIIFFDRFVFPFNTILDPLCRGFIGKNVYAVCRKADA